MVIDFMINLKFNFVFLFARDDFWKSVLGEELYNSPNVRVYKRAFNGNKFLEFLFRIHWSYKINSLIELPFKSIWFKKMYTQDFKNDLPLCFVYMGGNNIRYDGGFCDYVRKQSSENRQVIYHGDLISKKCKYDYSIIRNKVDMATTYDKEEAEKYGIYYFPETVYSKLISDTEDAHFEQDVYFLGVAKDRLPKIMQVYGKLHSDGLKVKFLIAGVEPENQIMGEGIEYIKGISYKENLQNVIKSKCILEIIQGGSSDITLRTREAMAYRRKLLTNCLGCDEKLFNVGQLYKFNEIDDIDTFSLKKDFNPKNFEPKVDMNPIRRLHFIQEALEENNE